jgi:hypothetical protein
MRDARSDADLGIENVDMAQFLDFRNRDIEPILGPILPFFPERCPHDPGRSGERRDRMSAVGERRQGIAQRRCDVEAFIRGGHDAKSLVRRVVEYRLATARMG